jgi:hypothetical protein
VSPEGYPFAFECMLVAGCAYIRAYAEAEIRPVTRR